MTIKHIDGTERMLINIIEPEFYKKRETKKIFDGIPLMISDVPLIGYIALVYDKNSPLRKEDLAERKTSAVSLCNFPTAEESKNALGLTDDRTKAFLHKYIKAQNSVKWTQYISFEAAFYNNVKIMMDEQTGVADQEKIGKITTNNIKILEEMEKMKETLFLDDVEKAETIINFFPEDFARARKEAMEKAGFAFI